MYDFTLVVFPGSFGTSVAITLDLLRTAAIMSKRAEVPPPRWRVCSVSGGLIRLQSGLLIETECLRNDNDGRDHSIWVLPGLGLNKTREIEEFLAREDAIELAKMIRLFVDQGGRIAAGCSSVFLLDFAGVLTDRQVTTTWWLANALSERSVACRVDASRMVCDDGQIVTAGAAFAQTDLMLHLLRKLSGPKLIELLCQFLILDARTSQSIYVVPEALAIGDQLVAHAVQMIESSLPNIPSVSALAAHFCISERTLARHIKKATGSNTLALIQMVRLRKARSLLEQSKLSVEQVAEAVGYSDATALRRMVRKATGANPSRYRPGIHGLVATKGFDRG